MLPSTSAASRIADASHPAISAGNHTSCGLLPNSPVSHGGMFTGIQPAFATRNSPAITPSPIIDRMIVAVATSRSHRITNRLYYGLPCRLRRAGRDRDQPRGQALPPSRPLTRCRELEAGKAEQERDREAEQRDHEQRR